MCLRDSKGVNSVEVCEWQETEMNRLQKWEVQTPRHLMGLMEDELASMYVRCYETICHSMLSIAVEKNI